MSGEVQGPRVVADIGNSRMKWGLLDEAGSLVQTSAMAIDTPAAWSASVTAWSLPSSTRWAISSVNPPIAGEFERVLAAHRFESIRWFHSAAAVPMNNRLHRPESAGADRALATLAGHALADTAGAGLVIACGTAITIERVGFSGIWEGGAIAPGLPLVARSLNRNTAQLPLVIPTEPVPAWGTDTESALAAGVYWGTVGAVRELIARQGPVAWKTWTGGDGQMLMREVDAADPRARYVPDLVLRGLALVAFKVGLREIGT